MTDSSWYIKVDVKLELEIASGDSADDTYLDDKGSKVNRLIDNLISPHITTLPVSSNLTEDLYGAAIDKVCEHYKRKNKEFDSANSYKESFNAAIDSVIKRLRRDNESQSTRSVVTKSYATQPLSDE